MAARENPLTQPPDGLHIQPRRQDAGMRGKTLEEREKQEAPDPENPDPENPDPENPDPENPDPENPARLDQSCILMGAMVTGWMFLLNFVLKPPAVITVIAFILATIVAPVGIPAGILLHRQGFEVGISVMLGLGWGIIGAAVIAFIGLTIFMVIIKMWEKHGLRAALACQGRKNERRSS